MVSSAQFVSCRRRASGLGKRQSTILSDTLYDHLTIWRPGREMRLHVHNAWDRRASRRISQRHAWLPHAEQTPTSRVANWPASPHIGERSVNGEGVHRRKRVA